MLVILVLAISVLLQFSAAFFAFRLVKVTGKTYSWILISIALFFMGVRRLIPLYHLIFIPENTAPDLIDGIIGLILSFLMFFGVMKIRPLFTERKRVEEALRESEERYRTTMMSIGDGVITTDTKGRVELLNPVTEALTGWRQEEARGKQLEEVFRIINEETRQTVENPVRRVMREGMVVGLANHTVLISKDGKEHPIDDSGAPIRNEKSEITGAVLVFRDQTQERYAQKALRESESKFRRLFDSNVIGIIFWDTAGNIIGANDKFLQIVGYLKDDLLSGKIRWKDMTPPEYVPLDEKALKEMAVTGVSTPFEKEYIRKDGNRVPILLGAAMLEGREETGICFIIDLTERKRAEDALRDSERKFHETVVNLDEGFYSVTLDGLLLEHNQAFNRLLGFDRTADLKGTHLPDFWQNPDERREYLQALTANGSISNYQINAKTQTGKKISVLASAHLVKDKDNRPLRIEGIFLDITERIRAEESLRRQAERLRNMHRIDQAILHTIESPEAIIQTAIQHVSSLLSCRRTSISIFDFKMKQVRIFASRINDDETIVQTEKSLDEEAYGDLGILRQGKMEIVEDMSLVPSPSAAARIRQTEGILSCINVPFISAQGLYGILNIGWEDPRIITPEETEIAGEVAGQITIALEQARLLQETKNYAAGLEDRVRERTAQLEASNKELEAFSYSVSHDLRAPLRHINGYVDLLIERFHDSLPEKGIHYLDTVADSARQMATLIDNLLQFSRTGRQEMRQADIDMNIIFTEVLETVKNDNPGRSIEWVIGTLPHVYGDHALLRLVWFNLLSNAVKFTRAKEKAMIEIGFKEDDKECVFSVRDNGAGFDMQYAQKLFGVFQRLHSSEEFEGTGIGLANVRRIILKHGGRTWAEGELDKGAIFYFTLPKNKENKPWSI